MDCRWVKERMSEFLAAELDAEESKAIARHLSTCYACRARQEQTLLLEKGLRETLHSLADGESLQTEEKAAILTWLTAQMEPWKRRSYALQPIWAWIGMAAVFVLVFLSLVAPWMNTQTGIYLTRAIPPTGIATAPDTPPQLPLATVSAVSVRPTAVPAAELILNRVTETASPIGTGYRN